MDFKITQSLLKSTPFPKEDFDKLIDILADIYIENCGISMGSRTIAYYTAISLIENHNNVGFSDAVDYFLPIMDKKDQIHQDYDIYFVTDEQFEEILASVCEDYPHFKELLLKTLNPTKRG